MKIKPIENVWVVVDSKNLPIMKNIGFIPYLPVCLRQVDADNQCEIMTDTQRHDYTHYILPFTVQKVNINFEVITKEQNERAD